VSAAFWLAIVGLVLSVASLTWQFATFRLTGSLVRAELIHGAMGADGATYGAPGKFNVPMMAAQGYVMEVVGIEVFNRGRIGVNIARWSMHSGKESFMPVAEQRGPDLPYRLEPGVSAQWFMPMDTLRKMVRINAEVLHRPNPAQCWATVQLGTGKTAKAKRTMRVRG